MDKDAGSMQKRCSIASIKYTYRRQVSTQLQMMEGAAINSGPFVCSLERVRSISPG